MPQTFSRRSALGVRVVGLALLAMLPALLAWSWWRTSAWEQLGEPVAQPIPFSHKHHVGDDGIDCRYCHATVETARSAGLPATSTCLTCHSQLYTDAAILAPLHESARTGRPIAWRRVHTLPDFVYFAHGPHVAKGVGCIECHGRVDQMALTWRARPLQMQWCLDCHRNPAKNLRPRSEIYNMEYVAENQAELGPKLMKEYNVQSKTDCWVCHR